MRLGRESRLMEVCSWFICISKEEKKGKGKEKKENFAVQP
jgi:hypothetical protein